MSDTPPPRSPDKDDFYVGYAKAPARFKRTMRLSVICLVALILACAALLTTQRTEPRGDGKWGEDVVALRGQVIAAPYPLLRIKTKDGGTRTILLASMGKIGAQRRIAGHDGLWVTARGVRVDNRGWTMLELVDDTTAITRAPNAEILPPPSEQALGPATLNGEIVDSKCYLGVMQPGKGITHKACAALCVIGGIPPVFVVRHSGGGWTGYLLTDLAGAPVHKSPMVLNAIGEPVVLSGSVLRRDGMLIFRADLNGMKRLRATN
jgi:hypothetical protein